MDEEPGCSLLLPSCLLPDKNSTGNEENQYKWDVCQFHLFLADLVLPILLRPQVLGKYYLQWQV